MMYQHKNSIFLEKLERGQLSVLQNHKKSSWWGTHHVPIVNQEDQEKWFDSLDDKNICLFASFFQEIEKNKYKNPTGYVLINNIDYISRVCSVSAGVFRKEFKNQLFEAGIDFIFEILNMRRIEAEVLETNLPAQKLEIDFLKFQVEGVKREAIYKCGKYYNSLMLGMLREDWQKRKKGSQNTVFDCEIAEQMIEESKQYTASLQQKLREAGW